MLTRMASSVVCVRLILLVLLNSDVVKTSYNDVYRRAGLLSHLEQQRQQVDYNDLTDNIDPYKYAGTISKRSSKGSCTCTCETEPVMVETAASTSSRAQNGGVAFMRTAGVSKSSHIDTAPPKTNHIDIGNKMKQEDKTASNAAVKSMMDDDQLREKIETKVMNTSSDESAKTKTNQAISGARDNWGHGSRFPWKRLPDTMCFRSPCQADKDCCLKFSICDRSANVCVDCWYGSTCTSEQQCCHKYPYCQRVWKTGENGQSYIAGGKCVNKL